MYAASVMDIDEILLKLKERTAVDLPGYRAQERMAGRVRPMPAVVPENARLSAVLCLLFPQNEELHVLLMKRREDRSAHSGQVSFPGGRFEPEDSDLKHTALREAAEEVGISASSVEIISPLTSLYIPVSNFNVFPYLAYAPKRPDYSINDAEVAHLLELPLSTLFHESRKTITDVVSPAITQVIKNVHAYKLDDGTIIWGATAMILSEIEALFDFDHNTGTTN